MWRSRNKVSLEKLEETVIEGGGTADTSPKIIYIT